MDHRTFEKEFYKITVKNTNMGMKEALAEIRVIEIDRTVCGRGGMDSP